MAESDEESVNVEELLLPDAPLSSYDKGAHGPPISFFFDADPVPSRPSYAHKSPPKKPTQVVASLAIGLKETLEVPEPKKTSQLPPTSSSSSPPKATSSSPNKLVPISNTPLFTPSSIDWNAIEAERHRKLCRKPNVSPLPAPPVHQLPPTASSPDPSNRYHTFTQSPPLKPLDPSRYTSLCGSKPVPVSPPASDAPSTKSPSRSPSKQRNLVESKDQTAMTPRAPPPKDIMVTKDDEMHSLASLVREAEALQSILRTATDEFPVPVSVDQLIAPQTANGQLIEPPEMAGPADQCDPSDPAPITPSPPPPDAKDDKQSPKKNKTRTSVIDPSSSNGETVICAACATRIYPEDAQIQMKASVWHRACLKCAICHEQLDHDNFYQDTDPRTPTYLCKQHFLEHRTSTSIHFPKAATGTAYLN